MQRESLPHEQRRLVWVTHFDQSSGIDSMLGAAGRGYPDFSKTPREVGYPSNSWPRTHKWATRPHLSNSGTGTLSNVSIGAARNATNDLE